MLAVWNIFDISIGSRYGTDDSWKHTDHSTGDHHFVVYHFVYVQRTQIYNDALTGLNNRKRLFFMLETKIPQADKEHPMILYLLDANRFKQINDKYGHAEGDNALISIAECMIQLAGEYNIFVARYGGDEFMMLDYSTELSEPARVMERLHSLIRQK